jgi:hypothetical protein
MKTRTNGLQSNSRSLPETTSNCFRLEKIQAKIEFRKLDRALFGNNNSLSLIQSSALSGCHAF